MKKNQIMILGSDLVRHVKIESRAIGYVFLFGGCMELSNPGMFKERSGWSGRRDRIAEIHRLPPVIRLIRKARPRAPPGSATSRPGLGVIL